MRCIPWNPVTAKQKKKKKKLKKAETTNTEIDFFEYIYETNYYNLKLIYMEKKIYLDKKKIFRYYITTTIQTQKKAQNEVVLAGANFSILFAKV
ncbi:Uncharacterized protein TCM_001573 [Theobroma cacao]|uniref:Uncharacterized protein n=1 Tax=Theobroma cacao TaxID=3641 RepID=A0A061DJZ0_THECC|nr:Uncharacterized protein TCM_001573 [Theobroma cacao]